MHQFLDSPLEIHIPLVQGCRFCPVTAIWALFAVANLDQKLPLFSFSVREWVTYSTLQDFIKFLAERAGLDPVTLLATAQEVVEQPLPPSVEPLTSTSKLKEHGCQMHTYDASIFCPRNAGTSRRMAMSAAVENSA